MSVIIEPRPYGPESTEAERQAIKDRVTVYRENILLIKPIPVQTPFSIELYYQRIKELTVTMPSHCLLVDLSESRPPDAASRAKAQENLKNYTPSHVALFNAKNPFFKIAMQFIFSVVGVHKQSMHQTFEQALEAVERARRQG